MQDMKRRISLMEEVNPDLVVSVHQNSYEGAFIKGAQIFFYMDSRQITDTQSVKRAGDFNRYFRGLIRAHRRIDRSQA